MFSREYETSVTYIVKPLSSSRARNTRSINYVVSKKKRTIITFKTTNKKSKFPPCCSTRFWMTSFWKSTSTTVFATDAVVVPTTHLLIKTIRKSLLHVHKCSHLHCCTCPIPDMEKILLSKPSLKLVSPKIHIHANIDKEKKGIVKGNIYCTVSLGDCE